MENEFVYVNLNKDFLLKEMKAMEKEADMEGLNEKNKPKVLSYVPENPTVKLEEINETDSTISIQATTDLGYFTIVAKLSTENLIELIELATKKLNKVKTVLEATK